MPTLQAYNISYQFDNGDTLFENLSCSLTQRRVGLVGRNGVGKSLFASIISGEQLPSTGTVTPPNSYAVYRQQASELLGSELSIAQYFGVSEILTAIKNIESGDCDGRWFEIAGEQWHLPALLHEQLATLGLPKDLNFPCAKLSGGQLARLQLWQLFKSDVQLLILDEPSNHLDEGAKQWLINAIENFTGTILLISHDRSLLREMNEIWELSSTGLSGYGGNYDFYAKQKQTEQLAIERQLAQLNKVQQKLARQAQLNREKAEQRAAQGNRLRKGGSQSKILLDFKKGKASASNASRNKSAQARQQQLQSQTQELCQKHENISTQKLYIATQQSSSHKAISVLNGVLPFGKKRPISLQAFANNKLHLKGNNGSGKSTLLKGILGEIVLSQGELLVNTPVCYLDQHFGVIQEDESMLANMMTLCEGMTETYARTLLAGLGFRRDAVYRIGKQLSGGEKMKLAVLVISHQAHQPFLLLDEPDNHLDLASKQLLAKALLEYRGGFILISHDLDFAQESGVNCEYQL
ncbi:ATP-binding cassette domain-containing protein [Thalassotalea euphylliae]|uniref:ABC transporter ATP-binding protein n=1 Tax=Thalassotalea euphylliae TaxID=1655234 RepID=A0A3E0U1C8_9GAMM|nr:ATP-binding cassette domain-containing protein [Thalassotalea euphylliae]REL30383.1 ABC transporter ATP-binding protein [Thalassotalea euphylliae]